MGHGVDVVPFEAVAAVAAGLGAADAVEAGRLPELEGGAQLDGYVAAEVGHGLDAHTVVDDGFDKGVLEALVGEADGHRPSPHYVAGLARVGMAPAVGGQVDHHHDVGPGAGAFALAGEQGDQGIGAGGVEAVPGRGPGAPAQAGGFGLDAVDDAYAHRGGQGTANAHHAELVAPVAEVTGAVLGAGQVLGRLGLQGPFAHFLLDRP